MTRIRLAVVSMPLIAVCTPAKAADKAVEIARSLYEDGLKQYNLGHFDVALQDFESAYQAKPDPAFLFNIGQCRRMLGQPQQAILAYRAYLRELPDAPNRGDVHALVTEMEKELVRRAQETPPTGTIPPTKPSVAPTPEPQPVSPPLQTAPPSTVPAPVSPAPNTSLITAATRPAAEPGARPPLYKRWWLWTGVSAVVVVAIGVGLGVGLSSAPGVPNAPPGLQTIRF